LMRLSDNAVTHQLRGLTKIYRQRDGIRGRRVRKNLRAPDRRRAGLTRGLLNALSQIKVTKMLRLMIVDSLRLRFRSYPGK
jgi:hypothetical protein